MTHVGHSRGEPMVDRLLMSRHLLIAVVFLLALAVPGVAAAQPPALFGVSQMTDIRRQPSRHRAPTARRSTSPPSPTAPPTAASCRRTSRTPTS
jgi:hypothetical protein